MFGLCAVTVIASIARMTGDKLIVVVYLHVSCRIGEFDFFADEDVRTTVIVNIFM